MNCNRCPQYRESPDFNECKLLGWECCRMPDNCKCVNDDGTINQEEFDKEMKHL